MSTDDEEEKVGYGKPPKKSRFKPGQSGNPRGRRKRTENIGLAVLTELRQPITVRENGQEQVLTKRDAIAKTIVAGALAKNVKMIQILMSLVPDQFRIPEASKPAASAPVSAEEAEILERFFAQRLGLATEQNQSEPSMAEDDQTEPANEGEKND
ncbi:DUF5681 domain-containing protein [Mesorhizobium sp. BR1-1-2]|uniref:DUF5681 domain-containing protein n=1 Tax=Mesorhizobium sp. BR1-1-2 TaxID=2876652 RepID=UPI001CCEA7E9|nr:DUF5681 domain-containing protein [Mesorhizobium sp. BR1-1-2]MBZ9965007.1 DUF5681 domain-containing protein [Mesorhizobium sp. BR1-1-2]